MNLAAGEENIRLKKTLVAIHATRAVSPGLVGKGYPVRGIIHVTVDLSLDFPWIWRRLQSTPLRTIKYRRIAQNFVGEI